MEAQQNSGLSTLSSGPNLSLSNIDPLSVEQVNSLATACGADSGVPSGQCLTFFANPMTGTSQWSGLMPEQPTDSVCDGLSNMNLMMPAGATFPDLTVVISVSGTDGNLTINCSVVSPSGYNLSIVAN